MKTKIKKPVKEPDIETKVKDTLLLLLQMEKDLSVPRNIRDRIKSVTLALQETNKNTEVKINISLQELDEIAGDPNIPVYTRTQIWNIVSMLEML